MKLKEKNKMRGFLKVYSIILLILMIIAFIGLVSDPTQTGFGAGIILCLAVIVQCVSTLIYFEEQE